jgi:hypothetical protein
MNSSSVSTDQISKMRPDPISPISHLRAPLGALVLVLLVAGCQSGGHHDAEVEAPPVLASAAPAVLSPDKGVSRKQSRLEQPEPRRKTLLAQVSTRESTGGQDKAQRLSGSLPLPQKGDQKATGGHPKVRQVAGAALEVLPVPAPSSLIETTNPATQSDIDANPRLASHEIAAVQNSAGQLPLTLEDAIAISLADNPDLVAQRSAQPAAQAAYRAARTYPFNPQIQVQVFPYTRDPNGNTDIPVSQQYVLIQTFELGGQQRFRAEAADASWNQVRGTIWQAELLNVAQTERLFFAALYQRELRDLNQVLTALNEQLVGIMERRMNAGQANAADVALTRLQAESSRRQQRLAEASYQTALMALHNQLNLGPDAQIEFAGGMVKRSG